MLNEHRADDPEGDPEGYLWAPVRICAAVERHYGERALGELFTALGTRFHDRGEWDALPGALAELGLPAGLLAATGSAEYDAAIRASHARAIALAGTEVGTPVLGLTGPDGTARGFFGPIVSPAPTGQRAGRLWDGFLLLANTPQFYELKRARPA